MMQMTKRCGCTEHSAQFVEPCIQDPHVAGQIYASALTDVELIYHHTTLLKSAVEKPEYMLNWYPE